MRVYHFVARGHGISNIAERRLKVSNVDGLNDPFELLGADLAAPDQREFVKGLRADYARDFHLLCFSRLFDSPPMWSHYAERHFGMCLGFEVDPKVGNDVVYSETRMPIAPQLVRDGVDADAVGQLIGTKSIHWAYEHEWRVWYSAMLLDQVGDLRFKGFDPDFKLVEVILGCRWKGGVGEVVQALGSLRSEVDLWRAGLSYADYRIAKARKFEPGLESIANLNARVEA